MLTNEHERIQDLFFALLDGSLSEDERQEVESHVATCPECAEELRVTRETDALVAALPQRELPEGFCERFFARLATENPALGDEQASAVASAPPSQVDSEAGTAFPEIEARIASDHQAGERRAAETRPIVLPLRPEAARSRLSFRLASRLAACLAVACVLALAWWAGRPSEPALAVLEWTSGAVTLQAGGDGRAHELEKARALRAGDIIETGVGARSLVRLGATGSVRLDAGTRVAVVALGSSDDDTFMKVQIERGALWVEDTSDARCVVQTRGALIVPAGTVYDVRVNGDTTEVDVWEGQVDFQSTTRARTTGSSGRLEAGQKAEVTPASPAVRVGLVDVASREKDAWVRWNRSMHAPAPVAPRAPMASPVPRSPSPPPWVATPPATPTWGTPSSTAGSGSDGRSSPQPQAGGSLPPRTPSASGTPPGGVPGTPPTFPSAAPRVGPVSPRPASPAGGLPPSGPRQGRPQVVPPGSGQAPGARPSGSGAPRVRPQAPAGAGDHGSHGPRPTPGGTGGHGSGHPGGSAPHAPAHSPGASAPRPHAGSSAGPRPQPVRTPRPQGPQVIDMTYPTAPSRPSTPQTSPAGTPQAPSHTRPTPGSGGQATPGERRPGQGQGQGHPASPGARQPGQGPRTGSGATRPRSQHDWPQQQRRRDPSQQQRPQSDGPRQQRTHDWSRPQRTGPRDTRPRVRQQNRPSSTWDGGLGSTSPGHAPVTRTWPVRERPVVNRSPGRGAWGGARPSGGRSPRGNR